MPGQLAGGNERAFKILYDLQFLSIFRFAKKFVENRQAAEDITTDAFLKLWDKRGDFDNMQKVKSFLFTTTKNACLNYLRDERRHTANHEQLLSFLSQQSEKNVQQHEITEQILKYIEEEIEKLPVKLKNILRLHLNGMKNAEIAGELGIAEKTVRNLKVDAMKALRIAVLKNELLILLLISHLIAYHPS